MPKKLIVCADGTWNTEDQTDQGTPCPTNVVKLARMVLPTDPATRQSQVVYYHSGVGTSFGQRVGGGAFGAGLFANVRDCYRFLIHNYEEGDELHFFGFSRGAYTVRSLAGLIRNSGILRRGHEGLEEQAATNYRSYRADSKPSSDAMQQFRAEHAYGETLKIRCVGVWDTVGSLGIPGLDGRFRLPGGVDWQFHDVTLSRIVENAFHALAIHEHRAEFEPTLWLQAADAPAGQRLEQHWFSGVHSDVGGGYAPDEKDKQLLSDTPLLWMLQRATECGLAFDPQAIGNIQSNALADAHDSFSTLYKVIDFLRRQPHGNWRTLGPAGTPNFERVHPTAIERFHRQGAPKFWPDTFEAAIQREPWPLPEPTRPVPPDSPPAGAPPSPVEP